MARWIRLDRNSNPVLRAAAEWRDCCLLGNESLFGRSECWTVANVETLRTRVFDNPIVGRQTFYEKLDQQLSDAPQILNCLAGEFVWLLFLFPSEGTITGNTKRNRIKRIWQRSSESLDLSDWRLTSALDYGIGGAGQGFKQHLWSELGLLVHMVEEFKHLKPRNQMRLLRHPYDYANWLDSLIEAGHPQSRHTILYLLFPDTFERISSTKHKKWIAECFAHLSRGFTGVEMDSEAVVNDKRLAAIRDWFETTLETDTFDFYEEKSVEREWWKEKYRRKRGKASPQGSRKQSLQYYEEGGWRIVVRTEFPRNRKARQECIRIHGKKCSACGIDFRTRYGERGTDFIHVHHLNPISAQKVSYVLNVETDLRPLCPNCHAMIHVEEPMLTIEQLKALMRDK
jgi:hypothetical protein